MRYAFPFLVTVCMAGALTSTESGYAQETYGYYKNNPLVEQNPFLKAPRNQSKPPCFLESRDKLPVPSWDARPDVIKAYWKAWEIGFGNLHSVKEKNNFVSPYIDAAFNGNIFIWDTCFMTLFGRYGAAAFPFQGSLDNFYRKQKGDGYICREIYGSNGQDCFERFDPKSTGPNIMPWAEWEYYKNFNDKERLSKVFPALLAYHQWFSDNRTWKDGSIFLSGWGCGMDNQPRLKGGYHHAYDHGHMSWIDGTMQQILSGKILIDMARELDRERDVEKVKKEVGHLSEFVNSHMWNEEKQCYADLFRDGTVSPVQTVGAYWGLLADVIPADRIEPFVKHLKDPDKFNRPHRVPTLSADDPGYNPDGGYWCGAVWAPTTYMVLRGLTKIHRDDLAYDIACNHVDSVVKVFGDTGTFFENYAPEKIEGRSRKNFVGWTGLPPIAELFEYVFGIRPDVPNGKLVWDVRLTDAFGVDKYPFGRDGLLNLHCAKRSSTKEEPRVSIESSKDLMVELIWDGGRKEIPIKASSKR